MFKKMSSHKVYIRVQESPHQQKPKQNWKQIKTESEILHARDRMLPPRGRLLARGRVLLARGCVLLFWKILHFAPVCADFFAHHP